MLLRFLLPVGRAAVGQTEIPSPQASGLRTCDRWEALGAERQHRVKKSEPILTQPPSLDTQMHTSTATLTTLEHTGH